MLGCLIQVNKLAWGDRTKTSREAAQPSLRGKTSWSPSGIVMATAQPLVSSAMGPNSSRGTTVPVAACPFGHVVRAGQSASVSSTALSAKSTSGTMKSLEAAYTRSKR